MRRRLPRIAQKASTNAFHTPAIGCNHHRCPPRALLTSIRCSSNRKRGDGVIGSLSKTFCSTIINNVPDDHRHLSFGGIDVAKSRGEQLLNHYGTNRFPTSFVREFGSCAAAEQQELTASNEGIVDKEHGNQFEEGEEVMLAEVQEANERLLGHIEVKQINKYQWGVFTSRPFPKGSIVISSSLLNNDNNNSTNSSSEASCSHSIQIDWEKHILMNLPARFLNHSCDPNVGVGTEVNGNGSYDFVALCDIDAGEEVRFDYETTEYEVGAFSECHCGAINCRCIIRGYKHNANVIQAKYGVGKNVAGYLLDA